MREVMISRRQMFRQLAVAALPLLVPVAEAQKVRSLGPPEVSGELPIRLVKQFEYAFASDISPDGSKLALRFTKNPVRSFAWSGTWEEKTKTSRDEALSVVTMGSWKQTYSVRPPTDSGGAFFGDGEALYAEMAGATEGGRRGTLRLLIDLKTGKTETRLDPYEPDRLDFYYQPLDDRALLGVGLKSNAPPNVLVRVDAPLYRETMRVPYAPTGRATGGLAVSANRRLLVHGFDDDKVAYRRANDLAVVWVREIEQGMRVLRVGLSADGSLAAVFAEEGSGRATQKGYISHVTVLSGKDGAPLAKLAVTPWPLPAGYDKTDTSQFYGAEGVAISPDGKLLAAGHRVLAGGKKLETHPTVTLFEIASGKKVATITHDRFRRNGGEFLYAGVRCQFTPDGKYLVTSGLNTYVWEIGSA